MLCHGRGTLHLRRFFSQQTPAVMRVFDRDLKRLHRDRAAMGADRNDHDMLRDEIADRLVDRLVDIKKTFPVAVDLGAGSGHLRRKLGQRGGIQKLIQVESSEEQIQRGQLMPHQDANLKVVTLNGDEENLPSDLEDGSVDLVMSNLSLHWVNDLPGTFARVRRLLKPDGVFIASMLGGDTLQELRSAFALADMERLGGLSSHTSPFAGVADVGNLMTRAGFALPTVDQEKLTVKFPDAFTLMEALRGMGEQNADLSRQPFVSRDVILAAAAAYDALYKDDDGYVDATFNVRISSFDSILLSLVFHMVCHFSSRSFI
jgi:NADH dehydrogenase [ubiquinone] 1 alpha subcomplex assembly factor 5